MKTQLKSKPLTVLIVEDEKHIADLLDTNLTLDGYKTILSDTGQKALNIIDSRHTDIILLDVMLPDASGIDICRTIKHRRPDIPILILSALGQSSDRIKGLKSGADDYLPKPFELEELSLRMDNLLERYNKTNSIDDVISLGEAMVDFQQHTIIRDKDTHKLTSKESLLLKFMVEKKGEALSRQQILDEVWGYEHFPNTRTIDNFITTFRKYIEADPSNPKIITTLRGIGYRLN